MTYNDFEYVFVRGTNNRIFVNVFNGLAWRGWQEVPARSALPGPVHLDAICARRRRRDR